MRLSSFALLGGVGFILVSVSGCRIEAKTQTTFEDKRQPAKVASRDWNGEPITINNDGINPLGGYGGVEVKVSNSATKISVEAVFAALADDDKESDAQASIRDAIPTLAINETANGFDVRCGHGKAHGTSGVAGSGCKIIRVTIPPSTPQKPHNLTVSAGSGEINIGQFGDGAPFVSNVKAVNNGLGVVEVRVQPVKDASLFIVGDDAVTVRLPANFSVKSAVLTVDEDDGNKAEARKRYSDFPSLGTPIRGPYPAAGATADAAALLDVQSTGPFDSDTITISKL